MSRKRLTPAELEDHALRSFLDRLRAFLAADPYWMHVLTMDGGRKKRRQVSQMVADITFTIPHFDRGGPLNRDTRRKVERWAKQESSS